MLALLSILAFTFIKSNPSVIFGKVANFTKNENTTVLTVISDMKDQGKNVTYFPYPVVRETLIATFLNKSTINSDDVFVFKPMTITVKNTTLQTVYSSSVDDLVLKINNLAIDEYFIVAPNSTLETDSVAYITPVIWNCALIIVILIILAICSISYFSNIAVQTKFTKKD